MRLFSDYHTHTVHSHGKGRVIDNTLAGARAGLEIVGIADHGPSHLFGVGISGAQELLDIKMEVQRVNEIVDDVKTLTAVEANVVGLDGELDVPYEVLKELDIVLCGMHHMVKPNGWDEAFQLFVGNFLAHWSRPDNPIHRRIRNSNTKAVVEAVLNNPIDIITHPGLQMPIDTNELAKACAKRGTALEINTSHRNVSLDFIKLARREGAYFAIDSDAHTPSRVGDQGYGIELAEKAGLKAEDIINAYPER